MTDNPYREASIEIGGKRLPLRYNWDAIARINARWVDGAYDLQKIDDLAEMVAIGLSHPEYDADRVRQESPPIYPTIEGVNTALWRCYYGTTKEMPSNPPKPGLATLLSKLCELVPQWASSRATSGR
jgi:hypothetical protein